MPRHLDSLLIRRLPDLAPCARNEAPIDTALGIGLAVALITANGFFVAAEFALVAVERSKVDLLADEGDRRAKLVSGLLNRLSFHLSGAQLGITLTSLGLGFIAEPALGAVIEPVLEPLVGSGSRGVSIALALSLATVFQTVFGELVPKIIAIAKPLRVAMLVGSPYRAYSLLVAPFVLVLDGTANAIVRWIGVEPASELTSGRSLDELEYLVRSSGDEGTLSSDEVHLLTRSIHFADKTAADALTPRPEVTAVAPTDTLEHLANVSIDTGWSRFPVVGADLDDVRGVVNVKAIFEVAPAERSTTTVSVIANEALVVPEGKNLEELLALMRRTGEQMAVVIDEHGGTAGVITVEDLVEEVVGDIADEHDEPELTVVREAHGVVLAGSLHPDEVEEACGFELPAGDYETLAGYALDTLQRIPSAGELFTYQGWCLEVVEMDGLRVSTMRVTPPGVTESGVS